MTTLREARIRRLLSIRALAGRAGVVTRTVVEIEAGRQAPRFATMRRLADALGVAPEEIDEFRAAIEAALEDKDAAPRDRGGVARIGGGHTDPHGVIVA